MIINAYNYDTDLLFEYEKPFSVGFLNLIDWQLHNRSVGRYWSRYKKPDRQLSDTMRVLQPNEPIYRKKIIVGVKGRVGVVLYCPCPRVLCIGGMFVFFALPHRGERR